jgi:serine/threonine protein kinase
MAGEATIGLGGDIGTTAGIMADGTGGADAARTVVAGMAADGTAIIEHVIACGTGEQFARGCAGQFPPTGVAQGVVFGSDYDRRAPRSMSTEPLRTCPSCGNEFSGAMEFCPVCMLRKGLADGVASGESSASEDAVRPTTSEQAIHRFEHYQLVTGDLGLAKTLDESVSEAGISSPGAFVGTPEFASPEQFAGVSVDIRSDLYSLGVTLWVMVTGQTPFRGSSAEVMYQHQHAPLPRERLKDVPQPVVVLLEKLLEKDPT